MTRHRRAWSFLLAFVVGLAAAAPSFARSRRGGGRGVKRLIISVDSRLSEAEKAELAQLLGLDSVEDLANIDLIIIEVPDDQLATDKAKLRGYKHVQDVEDDFYVNWLKIDGPQTFASTPLPGLPAVMGGLPKMAAVQAPPSDLISGEVPWGIERVKAPQEWDESAPATMGAGATVAVVDTGVDCGHPDLDCRLDEGVNFVDPEAEPMDDQGHGTHVAGTIAARWDGKGVVGVAPLAHVIPVKVLDEKGGGSVSNIVRGINWAANRGVDVINMSLGSPQTSPSLERAVARALNKGVTIVAASGNEGPDNDPSYPGAYPGVIAVGASDKNNGLAKFSSQGDYVSFIAPGVDVISTAPGGKYAMHSGTSMASPHVGGLAAIAAARGARGPAEVAQTMAAAARRLCTRQACLPPAAEGVGLIDARRISP
ncbi:MAG: S8 family peptidase [Elusimicrobia bacterium]|nr:S8 family peptidase [Elusimicrobiota bacterium]